MSFVLRTRKSSPNKFLSQTPPRRIERGRQEQTPKQRAANQVHTNLNMAGIAPAYQHESNDAWLNQVVNDIIDQASVRSRSRSRSVRSPSRSIRSRSRSIGAAAGRRWREPSRDSSGRVTSFHERISVPERMEQQQDPLARQHQQQQANAAGHRQSIVEEDNDAATFLSARSEKSRQVDPQSQQHSLDHAVSRGSLSSDTASLHTGRETPRSMLSAPSPPPPAYTRRFNNGRPILGGGDALVDSESSAKSTHALTTTNGPEEA